MSTQDCDEFAFKPQGGRSGAAENMLAGYDALLVTVRLYRSHITALTEYCSECLYARIGAAIAVAVNVTGLPAAPATTACTVFVPGVAPSVQLARVAIPLALVVRTTVAPAGPPGPAIVAPLPPVTWNVTTAFAIGCGGIPRVGLP